MMERHLLNKRQHGMTLMEILIVIAILGTLLGVLANSLMSSREGANIKLTRIAMDQLKTSLDRFSLSVGRYPTSSEGLGALIKNPGGIKGWTGPYADAKQIVDPWNQELEYSNISRREYTISSPGPDGESGTEDDINYPEETEAE